MGLGRSALISGALRFLSALLILALLLFIRYEHGYLLFHASVEIFTIVVAMCVFVIAWNTRRQMSNHYMFFAGVAFFFIGIIAGLHMLSYQGMSTLQERGANLSTQLWIAGQYMAALAFLLAPAYLTRKAHAAFVFGIWGLLALGLLALIYWNLFPECLNPTTGLTRFKIISEYIIFASFLAAMGLLIRFRDHFDRNVLLLLILSLGAMAAGEICFTLYKDVYGVANLVGHFFRVGAFYLIYKALVETGLKRPFDLLFRELRQSETALRNTNEELARRVAEKTAHLSETIDLLHRQIAERKQTEETLRLYSQRLEILNQIDKSILAAASLEEIAATALKRVNDLIPCWWVSITLFDGAEGMARVQHIVGGADNIIRVGDEVPQTALGIDQLGRGEIRYIRDMQTHPMEGYIHPMKARGLRSYLNVPLIAGDTLIGSLNLGSQYADAFQADHLAIAREVADPLAIAMQQARLNEQVRLHGEELEHKVAERTAELEAFNYSVSHDLRSPLRSINGFASILKRRAQGRLEAEDSELLEQVIESSRHMNRLIEDLLAYSRLGRMAIRLQPVALESVVGKVLQMLTERIVRQEARIHLSSNLPTVVGDSTLLSQVFSNLLENALTYQPEGGTPQISIMAWEEAGHAIIRISDNGIGIPIASQQKIFEPFLRLHGPDKYPGTGIGLAIVKKAVDLMNGDVRVESREGEGTSFFLRFALP